MPGETWNISSMTLWLQKLLPRVWGLSPLFWQWGERLEAAWLDAAGWQWIAQLVLTARIQLQDLGILSEDQRLFGRNSIHLTKWGKNVFANMLANPVRRCLELGVMGERADDIWSMYLTHTLRNVWSNKNVEMAKNITCEEILNRGKSPRPCLCYVWQQYSILNCHKLLKHQHIYSYVDSLSHGKPLVPRKEFLWGVSTH